MTKKAPSIKKKPGRKSSRSGVFGLPVLSDRKPPMENCHVVVSSPGWGTCVDGGSGRCTFPDLKGGGKTTQMVLCETNGEARLFLQAPKKRPASAGREKGTS